MLNKGLFTSNKPDWETPQELFDALHRKFDFMLDVAASETNAKCKRFFTEADNGLQQEWTARNWMNPPYGRQIIEWCKKAHFEAKEKGNLTVALLPARTDTIWFQEFCAQWHYVFIKGRLRFSGGGGGASPCAISKCYSFFRNTKMKEKGLQDK